MSSNPDSTQAGSGNGLLREVQDVEVNYYVLVPFTTAAAALWAAGYIEEQFDCCVIGRAAVDQDALIVTGESDG